MRQDQTFPFIYGAQYYRAPSPDPKHWADDLKKMRELGFDSVKFWVQWRWSERREGQYFWDDLDQLMDLAAGNNLAVTLNLILDVAPGWIFEKYPDCRMVDASGHTLEPVANICRQLGGYPGPCHSHPGALEARKRFTEAAAEHFRNHPALAMWDVWNEPENNLMRRSPDMEKLLCYCPECHRGFQKFLQNKYNRSIERLNTVWGRCYASFDEVELPRDPTTVSDFIDWRMFHLEKLTADGRWRTEIIRKLDPAHVCYLHVVANSIDCFNAVSCVDDFALADLCDVFASTITSDTLLAAQAVSAAGNRVFYNAEWHINYGSTAMHQRIIDRDTFLREGIPQLGWGVRGFLFWQFRPETLGIESPAWGLIHPDGSSRPVTLHAAEFIEKLRPHLPGLMRARRRTPQIGIWRSNANEVFHFCMDGNLKRFRESVSAYADCLYEENLPFRIIDSKRDFPEEIAMIVMPSPYFLAEEEADRLDAFLRSGGILVTEGHLAGYNATTGRHSEILPGCGLAERWGAREVESTSSYHLPRTGEYGGLAAEVSGDVAKAMKTDGVSGGEYFPISAPDGTAGFGSLQFAELAGEDCVIEGRFRDKVCMISKTVGNGRWFHAGTLLGRGFRLERSLLASWLFKAAAAAGIQPEAVAPGIHVDILTEDGEPCFIVAVNSHDKEAVFDPGLPGKWRGVFHGADEFRLPRESAELFVRI